MTLSNKQQSYDTGFVPEREGSSILYRRFFNFETGVGGQEWQIPWKPFDFNNDDNDDWNYIMHVCNIETEGNGG